MDEFTIDSGLFDFNKDEGYRNNNINIQLKNLSSNPGTKTLIKGSTLYAGESRIWIDGWAYLKDEPKKLNISITSDDLTLSAFKEFFNSHKMNTERARINLRLNTEGDLERGFNLKSKIQIKSAGSIFFNKDIKDILLNIDAFFRISDNSLVINDISLYSGNILALRSKAVITNIRKNTS